MTPQAWAYQNSADATNEAATHGTRVGKLFFTNFLHFMCSRKINQSQIPKPRSHACYNPSRFSAVRHLWTFENLNVLWLYLSYNIYRILTQILCRLSPLNYSIYQIWYHMNIMSKYYIIDIKWDKSTTTILWNVKFLNWSTMISLRFECVIAVLAWYTWYIHIIHLLLPYTSLPICNFKR